MDLLLYVRAIGLPFLLLCSFIALAMVRGRIASPAHAFLFAFWGSILILFAYAATTAVLLWADETRAQMANATGLMLVVGTCAILSCALGLALGWRARVAGERFLIAFVRPPAGATSWPPRGWAFLALGLLSLALVLGAFAATYGVLSHVTLAG
ncbi:MAG TPA: hypothetical protein VGS80_08875 [Ktedonobacterales bacterium]|nr:hypothetical protein [Ktedonobacterales bacterium]